MKIALTGGTGFIGSHLYPVLKPLHEVILLSREDLSGFSVDHLREYFLKHQIEVIIHLATHFSTSSSPDDVERMIESNILLGKKLLDAIKDTPKIWFLNTGSGLEYGGEDQATPSNLYASSKKVFSLLLKDAPNPHLTLTIFESYGENDRRKKILQLIHESAMERKTLRTSPGDQVLDYCHVTDISHGYLMALNLITHSLGRDLSGKNFGLSGERVTLRDLAALYEEATQRKLSIDWGALPYRENEIMLPAVLPALPGWRSAISLKDGLRLLFAES